MNHAFAFLAALLLAPTAGRSSAAEPPAIAVFADGAELRGRAGNLADPAKASVAGRRLFDAGSPVRWMRIGEPGPVAPDAFVELDNGDRLPGRVILHAPEGVEWRTIPTAFQPWNHPESRPAVLAVAVADSGVVRVRRDRVRRVAWRRSAARRAEPRTLVLANGGAAAFRSVRWTAEGVIAFLDDGTTGRHGFAAIDELHLPPRPDPWNAWFESLVDESGSVQIETREGFRVTTPRSRWRPAQGSPAAQIMVQPTWSLDPLFLPVGAVSKLAAFGPAEAPLTWMPPVRATQRSTFGAGATWQVDRNARGGPLDTAGPPAGWGFGVHARTELEFPLCDGVQAFRGRVGLDRSVGSRGCIRASLHAEAAASPALWESGALVGAGQCADCGSVALTGTGTRPRSLVLVADDAHRGRPPGADPFDVGDVVDWCDPLLVLDPANVRGQVAARLPFVVPAWFGWEATPAAGGTVKVGPTLDPILGSERAGWATATLAEGGPLRLTRTWPSLRKQDRHLVIAVSGHGPVKEPLVLRVDGWQWELTPPARSIETVVPFVLPLDGRSEGPLAVEVVAPKGQQVQWHALGLAGPLDEGWFPLEPVQMESSAGSTFKRRDDGAILASMPPRQRDAYTIRLNCPAGGTRALRMDALLDPSLPKPTFGPGRASNGSFNMQGITVAAVSAEGTEVPVAIVEASGHPQQAPGKRPINAVLQNRSAYLPYPEWAGTPGRPNTVVLHFRADQEPLEEVVVRADFRGRENTSIGCFRFYGSADPVARMPVSAVTLVREPDPTGEPPRPIVVGRPIDPAPGS